MKTIGNNIKKKVKRDTMVEIKKLIVMYEYGEGMSEYI